MPSWNPTTGTWSGSPRAKAATHNAEALHVDYAPRARSYTVYMADEVDYAFPASACRGLENATSQALRDVQLQPDGRAITWPSLGLQLSLTDLQAGRLVAGPTPGAKRRQGLQAPAAPEQPAAKAPTSVAMSPAPAAKVPAPGAKSLAPAAPPSPLKTSPLVPLLATEKPSLLVLHGTWIPDDGTAFERRGAFYLWAEAVATTGVSVTYMPAAALAVRLEELVGVAARDQGRPAAELHLLLPSTAASPLPSPELARWLDTVPADEEVALASWRLPAVRVPDPWKLLPALGFAALERPGELQLGSAVAFWLHFLPVVHQAIARDQYIPSLALAARAQGGKTAPAYDVQAGWAFVSPPLDTAVRRLAAALPPVCRGATHGPARQLHAAEPLLAHCAAVLLDEAVRGVDFPQTFLKRLEGTLVEPAARRQSAAVLDLETYQAWQGWRERLARAHTAPAFDLVFRLEEPADDEAPWQLQFVARSRKDPSLQLDLADHWSMTARARGRFDKAFGAAFEGQALLLLGQAARMVPLIGRGLETDRPAGLSLTLTEAHAFLKVDAWLLEDAGFAVQVPAWWTPAGRKRLRARLVPAQPAKGKATAAKGGLGLEGVLAFRYELAIGGEPVSDAEWQALVAAKAPLVRFRGAWVELDASQLARVQALVEESNTKPLTLSPLELVRLAADEAEGDVELGTETAELALRLSDPRRLAPVDVPQGLKATLRDYQRRGLDWLVFLEQLGLNGCLADDMGLGKTVQVIARLVHERETEPKAGPTLLVAPTSVVGNWEKELKRFAPELTVQIHHGATRQGLAAEFTAQARAHHVTITSYALVRRDEALLAAVPWRRVVLDEAQNIKNPAAAQTRAIRRLKAEHRLALTGTPVENRLLDLWSLFDFLNPSYLGREAHFRKTFETPIQRDHDAARAELLRRLTGPLILRRVKTDPAIIQDLPDKIEQKLYCPLTAEQASLYEAVVRDAEAAVDAATGIARKGVVLATLSKLKQVCNHPAQFLQDGSAFDPVRSYKLSRLMEHAREITQGGERLLVFTQFAELGSQLEKYLRQAVGCTVFFLHGGTSRVARERMIAEFQDPQTGPAIFVLSLKAGGVGITLTQANHVFHFDRWWNPAVEEQATDRAFRIGQKRNVFVHKFVTLGTLEERIDAMLEDKRKLAASAVGSDESWLANLDNESFKTLIALDRAAVRD